MADDQPEGVGANPDPIDGVEEPHVPDGENREEQAVRAVLRQYFFNNSCS